ncbi:UNVERIFIED_CONTAM: hypothetical protein HDU68_005066 [Siphonaria sp. JEL0065]|nr:hypothetical protein HDU68_005066 [Siphonaria sp. JEL0065]
MAKNLVLPAFNDSQHRAAWQWALTSASLSPHASISFADTLKLLFQSMKLKIEHRPATSSSSPDIPFPLNMNVWRPKVRVPKKIAVVGVHGWFPGRLIQNVITGPPTGTSQRFAEKMEQGVRQYFLERHDINLPPNAISSIALEGHGTVEIRVEKLYNQIMKPETGYAKILKNADTIMVAAHSQGSPVSILLVSRLIREGLIDLDRQKVCILLMAGISHGPFPNLKNTIVVKYEAEAARQLFDFNDPNASITKRYHTAISQVLNAGIKICCVASWYDQVVPLYSATLHAFNHPSIYRAIHIEKNDYNPDFLSHLVVFALRLRNAGLSDRGLLVYLSEFLAGNVYGFGTQGHSTVYEEVDTYSLAMAWAMAPPISYNYSKMKDHYGGTGNQKPTSCNPYDPLDASIVKKSTDLLVPLKHKVHDPQPPFEPSRENPISDMLITSDPVFHTKFIAPVAKLNQYWLPWILAQITSDPLVYANEHVRPHLDEVMKLFDEWEPSGKALKELQYRLEPLRSRL